MALRTVLLALLLLLPRPGLAWIHGQSLTPPAIAAAVGFTANTAYDPLTSLSTVDVNNTKALGFHWFIGGIWPNCTACDMGTVTPASCFNDASGNVEITCDNSASRSALTGCVGTGGTSSAGTMIAGPGGYYVKMDIKSVSAVNSDFSFWGMTKQLGYIYQQTPLKETELDVLDHSFVASLWEVQITGNTQVSGWPKANSGSIGGYSVTNWNTFSALVVPTGGGAGYVNWYVNGSQVFSVSFAAGATWSSILDDTQCMSFGISATTPAIYVRDFEVWAAP